MNINHINEEIIKQIRNGSEKAFAKLYSHYYSYLNAIALYYLLDKQLCSEIVDDVFINVWLKKETLVYPLSRIQSFNLDATKSLFSNNSSNFIVIPPFIFSYLLYTRS